MSRLVLVPTPIGNLEDVTLRALTALREADVIAAEDTRRSGRLLAHHGIDARLVRIDAHTTETRAAALLAEHDLVAYVSDAGTPGVSDPGAELVRSALAAGHEVDALPGPTALLPALVLSGLPVARFTFEGFLPRKGSSRGRRVREIASREHPTVLFESPRRVAVTLRELAGACGPSRPASVSRELTKRYEETVRGTLDELTTRFEGSPARGEIVLVVGPAPERPEAAAGDAARTARALADAGVQGKTLRDALQALGVPRNDAYRLSLGPHEDGAEPDRA